MAEFVWRLDEAACAGSNCAESIRGNCLRYKGHLRVIHLGSVEVKLHQVYCCRDADGDDRCRLYLPEVVGG